MPTYEKSQHVLQPRQKRSREALERIVEAAEFLLRTRDLDAFSMADVAQIAEMPIGNIYRRFRGKAELLQAIKENLTAKTEEAVSERLSAYRFDDVDSLVMGLAEALSELASNNVNVRRILFQSRNSALDEIGLSSRERIFSRYRVALLPLLADVTPERSEILAIVSFQIVASAFIDKAIAQERVIDNLTWDTLAEEFGFAAIQYLKAHIPSSAGTPSKQPTVGSDRRKPSAKRARRAGGA
jgi:AcrR family transcriptional regulator